MERKALKGLDIMDFIHPAEVEARAAMQAGWFNELKKQVSGLMLKATLTVKEGTYVRITAQTSPRVFGILTDVCRILDFAPVPEVYIHHMRSLVATPCGNEAPYIVVTDYLLQQFDDEMLYYIFGNAITMIKAGHVEITTISAYLPYRLWMLPLKIKLMQYLHAADATSDRGGLLACQSFAAAARCHMIELGMPPAMVRKLFRTDAEAETFAARYLVSYENQLERLKGIGTGIARKLQEAEYVEAPGNLMFQDLFYWYKSEKGYQAVMKKYAGA